MASPQAMYVLWAAHPRGVIVTRVTILTPQQPAVPVLNMEPVAVHHQRRVETQPGV